METSLLAYKKAKPTAFTSFPWKEGDRVSGGG